jgi:GSH-dependent disulfide-bond oxidoreductase
MQAEQLITLYGVMSPNVIKVAIMLEELDLPYQLQFVALFKGEQFSPEFRKLNPLGKVPVLAAPELDHPLAESGAILMWLAERHSRFLPAQSFERYEVIQWLMIQMASVGPMLGQYTHFRLVPAGSEPYSLARYGTMAEKLYRSLDTRLADREWLAGTGYSIADIATFPWAEYLERHDFAISDYPNLKRWRDVIGQRAAVLRAKARIFREFGDVSSRQMQDASSTDLERFFGRTAAMPAQDYSAAKNLR